MNLFQSLARQFSLKPIDWDELEESLIRADLGVPMSLRIIKALQGRAAWTTITADEITKVTREEILKVLPQGPPKFSEGPGKPKVILIVGVNGTGKTTSAAKLANYLLGRGGSPELPVSRANKSSAVDCGQSPLPAAQDRDKILLAAADTFRAAAIEQLGFWANQLGVEMIRGQYNADPAALCYEAYQAAQKRGADFLICDTAGRLHTKANLMAELQKIKRALAKQDRDAPHEILLVVDATTGSNALSQAREFHQALGLTGLIVTKLDGSGQGGSVVAIQNELQVPARFVGTGEKIEDFAPFDAREFVAKML